MEHFHTGVQNNFLSVVDVGPVSGLKYFYKDQLADSQIVSISSQRSIAVEVHSVTIIRAPV